MTGMLAFFLAIGLIATILFVAGYAIGIKQSIVDAENSEDEESVDYQESNYTISIILAVIASISIIALAGVNPVFIYLGPLLSVVTAAMVGIAFFYERNMRKR